MADRKSGAAAKKAEEEREEQIADVEIADEVADTNSEVSEESAATTEANVPDEPAAEKPKKKAPAKKSSASKSTAPVGAARHHKGKRYAAALAQVDREKAYPAEEAVALVKSTSQVKFDATVEIHLKLGVDPRKAEQNIRGTVKLPAGTGKVLKVMAFVDEGQFAAAKKAGADFVSDESTLKKLADGWADFDVAVATPAQMPNVAKYGKALGPKGLMPNPKSGTVSDKPEEAIAEVKKGTIEYRVAKDATVHTGIGKVSFSEADLLANLGAYYQAILSAKPSDLKGTYVKSVTLASTMGPGIKVDGDSLRTVGTK